MAFNVKSLRMVWYGVSDWVHKPTLKPEVTAITNTCTSSGRSAGTHCWFVFEGFGYIF